MTPLTLENITLTYPDGDTSVTALDDVSFTARAGEMTAVVGESGSGKSSLLSVAAGLLTPTSGRVRAEGGTGLVFQQPNLLGALTVRDQLLVTDHIRGLRGRALRRRAGHADQLLARVGLAGFGHRRMGQLSGGQRQRVNIARALMGSPAVLLADEPTSALDTVLAREIVGLLAGVTRDAGAATVMVTHDRSLLDSFDRVVEMRDGRITEAQPARR
ncbi:ABC transporter ATP-binding protein [Corynebacterium marinum]|uniref:ABC transporter ATP-binding protein n=1 Tax=Corynebacterium marinum DSM 44953 TaxID=1224162 RepID=A0A0B6TWQ1_9CORY|nr:ATP-binding cassette domain-containing protein [Corynebacterium marinum]AJK70015.1 ABC transporter ATP-binding protein [Corynebacterium marinum DSM 44953]GGO13328.1 ABC transporter ATP-binding protein [Corynebacterium marinum]